MQRNLKGAPPAMSTRETRRPLTISTEGYTLIDTAELKRLSNIESRATYKLKQLKAMTEERFSDRRKAHIEAIAFVLGVGEIETTATTPPGIVRGGDDGENNKM